jgi:small-conductance mechanosensitive channel
VDDFSQNFSLLLSQLGSSQGWGQLALVTVGFGIAWLLANRVRKQIPSQFDPQATDLRAGSVQRLLLPLFALVFIWLAKVTFAKWHAVPILSVAVMLVASFALIRLMVYLLRQLFPSGPLLKVSERVLAFSVWGLVALALTGLLPEILTALDEVGFTVGKQKVSLLSAIQALLSVLLTIAITLTLSIIVENRVMQSKNLDTSMRVFAGKIIRALAFVVAIMIALPLMGIDITALSVFGGALGVGLGLGLQKIASNYVSGFVILLDRSIRPGDLVTISERHGVVSDIRARYTVVRGLDGTEAIIPNDSIIGNMVLNHTYSDRTIAVRTTLNVAYDCDTTLAMALLLEAGVSQARVLATPEPTVMIKALGDNGIELELVAWIRDAEQGQSPLRSDIYLAVLSAYRAAGIDIPYPQREIHLSSHSKPGDLTTVNRDSA